VPPLGAPARVPEQPRLTRSHGSGRSGPPLQAPPPDFRQRARQLLMACKNSICAGSKPSMVKPLSGKLGRRPEGGGGRSQGDDGRPHLRRQGGVNFSEDGGGPAAPAILQPASGGGRAALVSPPANSMVLPPTQPLCANGCT